MSLTTAILRSWRAPREVVRGLLALDRFEGRLLMYLTVALLMIFVAQWPRLTREATEAIPFEARLSAALFGFLFVGPLAFYLLSVLLTLILKVVAPVEGFAVRLALFFALLSVAPLLVLQTGLAFAAGPGVVALVSGLAVWAVWAMVLIAGLRVAVEDAQGQGPLGQKDHSHG